MTTTRATSCKGVYLMSAAAKMCNVAHADVTMHMLLSSRGQCKRLCAEVARQLEVIVTRYLSTSDCLLRPIMPRPGRHPGTTATLPSHPRPPVAATYAER
jgi:hypothetical protein